MRGKRVGTVAERVCVPWAASHVRTTSAGVRWDGSHLQHRRLARIADGRRFGQVLGGQRLERLGATVSQGLSTPVLTSARR